MSSPSQIIPSTSDANATHRSRSRSHTPPSIHRPGSTLASWLTWPVTRFTFRQSTEDTESTNQSAHYDGGKPDHASSVTLRDESLWPEVGVNKHSQNIPSSVVPVLLQGVSDVSPPQSLLGSAQDGPRKVDKDGDLDDLTRYSTAQKGKWRAHEDNDVVDADDWIRTMSLPFDFQGMDSFVDDWVAHTRPILQEYADRQLPLPLGKRLEVSIDEPSQFILGVFHLLVNRDRPSGIDRSRRLGPQLIENFLDVERWAREYFRSRHATQVIDDDIPTLLTIVINNFYEGQVQLIDQIVEFALENMRSCGRCTLGVEDFAFGFDFRMSQDLPFYVETCSRVREPCSTRPVEVHSTVEPVVTSSGRQVKPTKRAQESVEETQINDGGRKNKKKNPPKAKDKRPKSGSGPASSQPKTKPSRQALEPVPAPSKTTRADTKHRPKRSSNLKLPPITPVSSTPGTSQFNDSVGPRPSESAKAEKPEVVSDSNLAQRSSSRLKIKIRPMRPKGPTANESASTSADSGPATANVSTAIQEHVPRRSERTRPGGPRGPAEGGRGHGAEEVSTAKTREATSVKTADTQTTPPLGTGDAVPSAVDTSEEHSAINPSKSKSLAGTSSAGPHAAVDNTGVALQRQFDPGHPRRKKRKMDDCDD